MVKFKTNYRPFYNFQHTALTDVIFLLMIFFLLTSTFVVQKDDKENINNFSDNINSQIIKVSLLKNDIFIQNQKVEKKNFKEALKLFLKNNKNIKIEFEAHPEMLLRDFRFFLDEAQSSGVYNFSFSILK